MIAYYVTRKGTDFIVIPAAGVSVKVTPPLLRKFLSDAPDFASWSGDRLSGQSPEDFGTVIASREDATPPTILNQVTWNQRVMAQLRSR